jgi:hypothetical protein
MDEFLYYYPGTWINGNENPAMVLGNKKVLRKIIRPLHMKQILKGNGIYKKKLKKREVSIVESFKNLSKLINA